MKNKPKDILYCGVRQDVIETARPKINTKVLRYFYDFLVERYNIHLKKDVFGENAPWTDNPILKDYRFTNIRREHDRETKWVIDKIVNSPEVSYSDKLLNCILFRLYNKHETAGLIEMPLEFSKGMNLEGYRKQFDKASKVYPNRVFFTSAFYTTGMRNALKKFTGEENGCMRPLKFVYYLYEIGFVKKILSCKRPDEVMSELTKLPGIGDFLAYQIFVDFTYIEEFPFSENEFTVAGPGCKMGLGFLFDNTDAMTPEECLFWLRNRINSGKLFKQIGKTLDLEALFRDLPKYDRKMNVMSLENCMCELSKYTRAMRGQSKPKKRYKPQEGTK